MSDSSVLIGIVRIDMPSQAEVNKMRDQIFAGIDEEDGLDKAFEAIQSMRGKSISREFFVLHGRLTDTWISIL